jgi:hypothetical protein
MEDELAGTLDDQISAPVHSLCSVAHVREHELSDYARIDFDAADVPGNPYDCRSELIHLSSGR